MINFTHFQTFPKFPKSGQKFSTTVRIRHAPLPGIKAAIKELLTMKLPAKSEYCANGSFILFEVICL